MNKITFSLIFIHFYPIFFSVLSLFSLNKFPFWTQILYLKLTSVNMTHLLLMISWKPTLAIVTEEELNNKKESTLYRDSIQPCMFFWHSFLQGDNYFA